MVSSSSPADGRRVGLMMTHRVRVASVRDTVKHLKRGLWFLLVRSTSYDACDIKPSETSFAGNPLTL